MIYVFDLDGTLVDSTYRHGYLMEKLLQDEGIKVEDGFKEKFLDLKRDGLSSMTILQDVYIYDKCLVKRVVEKWIGQIESDEMLAFDRLYDDSIEILGRIRESGFQIFFMSLRQRQKAVLEELRRLGLIEYADKVYIGKPFDGVKYKAECLDELRKRDKVIMVGDTEVDYEAAKLCGVECFMLSRGFRSEDYLKKIGVSKAYNGLDLLI